VEIVLSRERKIVLSRERIRVPDLAWNRRWGEQARAFERREPFFAKHEIYGYQWGDPRQTTAAFVIPEFIAPYLKKGGVTLEIGPGGGRYSQFLKESGTCIFVEYNPEFFPILRRMFEGSKCAIECIHSTNCTFPAVPDKSVDFVFSFDCFVHLDLPLIETYLREIRRVLRSPESIAVLHYADQRKPLAQEKGTSFSPTDPTIMRRLVEAAGLKILAEDTERISHSAIMAFIRP
jgi:ubiquinone/menaquinone biosynthesis C-methylase UbiE